ncbi:hypothetical protein Sfum_2318 [Syntrophobacter fumaroxidans MPOB]|uniref:Uncharacterized protein n=1 Tax=Syntrophobacter fumaroxidans (strain DSM 10017 / MPOB) TaxID=335543 RepID=A0LKP7_SYNFM|nr:hypothetical protein Sfum_2318 [Syntrophobacter fumaroxidans MPOB]
MSAVQGGRIGVVLSLWNRWAAYLPPARTNRWRAMYSPARSVGTLPARTSSAMFKIAGAISVGGIPRPSMWARVYLLTTAKSRPALPGRMDFSCCGNPSGPRTMYITSVLRRKTHPGNSIRIDRKVMDCLFPPEELPCGSPISNPEQPREAVTVAISVLHGT